ncbi:hypothetical protein BC835DRAFT_1276193, partial [Cytidiella melzeri]
ENGGEPDVEELEGVELDISLEKSEDLRQKTVKSAYALMTKKRTAQEWKVVEQAQIGVYTGHAKRTKRHHKQKAREKEDRDSQTRNSHTAHAFRAFFKQRAVASGRPSLLEPEDALARTAGSSRQGGSGVHSQLQLRVGDDQ